MNSNWNSIEIPLNVFELNLEILEFNSNACNGIQCLQLNGT